MIVGERNWTRGRLPVHLATVPAGLNPGGLWLRLCSDDAVLVERALSAADSLERLAEEHGTLAGELADHGHTAWAYVYDGDGGECWATMIVTPPWPAPGDVRLASLDANMAAGFAAGGRWSPRKAGVMAEKPRRTEEPHDRLTRICDAMTETFDAHPEHQPDDKCIVFLDSEKKGGLVIYGYDDDAEAMTHLLLHLKAIFAANGKRLDLMFLDDDGITRG